MKDHKMLSFLGVRGIISLSSGALAMGLGYTAINPLRFQDVIGSLGGYAVPLTASGIGGLTGITLDLLAAPILRRVNLEKYANDRGSGEFRKRYIGFSLLTRAAEIAVSTIAFKSMLDYGATQNLAFFTNGMALWGPTLLLEPMAYDAIVLKENPLPNAGRVAKKVLHAVAGAPSQASWKLYGKALYALEGLPCFNNNAMYAIQSAMAALLTR